MADLVDTTDTTAVAAALAVVDEVLGSARDVDSQDAVDEATTIRLRNHGLDDSSLWLSTDAGFALLYDGGLDLVVRPEARGRGVGTTLAEAALEAPGELSAWSHGDDPAARRIATRLGLVAARSLWVMRRALPPDLPDLPDLVVPDGVTIRGYRDEDADDVLRINAAAFAHHPEQGSMDAAGLAERMAESWFDPAGLLVAFDDRPDTTEMLGFHWTKRHSASLGEVYVVAISPAAQGRGLGRALTLAGLHHLAGGGSTSVLLYVESDNAPARAVYARLGFEHAQSDTHVQYQRVG